MRGPTPPPGAALAICATALVLGAGVAREAGPGPGDGSDRAHPRACQEHLLADWRDDGVVQGRYRVVCYRLALRALPEDMRAYTSAVDDIWSAMTAAARAGRHVQSAGKGGPGR